MHKKLHFISICTILALGLLGCGKENTSGGQIGNHAKDIEAHDFDANAITWSVDNGEGLKIYVDNQALYLQFQHNNAAKNTQFFLDIDNNPNTGNHNEAGADYVVENGYLYQSQSKDTWQWKDLGAVKSVVEDGVESIMIDLSKLQGKTATFKANAQALGEDWIPVLYSPSNHQKTEYHP